MSITIRAYNVRFGDAILVTLGAGGAAKHVLFDFGNAPGGVGREGGRNAVFGPIAKDLRARTSGRIDVVVMTHEHLDHMEGFYSERAVFDDIDVAQVWMSIMSKPGYYDTHPNAKVIKKARQALAGLVERWGERRLGMLPEAPQRLLANNNVLDLSNKERIDYVRGLAMPRYLSRKTRAPKAHGLGSGIKVEILAPEDDASVYYPKGGKLLLDAATMLGGPQTPRPGRRDRRSATPINMAADEFEQLKDDIAEVDLAAVFALDKAENNTSLVVRLTVGGKVLMFCGDAEVESWRIMKAKGLLAPVDVLKVAHHGSVNGMPFTGDDSVLDAVLKPGKQTTAIVSTCRGAYPASSDETTIPSPGLMKILKKRCARVIDTEHDAAPGTPVVFTV